jgi:hypothetical protein
MKSPNAEDVLAEAKKLHDILVHVRSESAKNVKGILLMCGTCKYTKKDFPSIGTEPSLLWKHGDLELEEIEIIIFNLSTEGLREEFFKKAIPTSWIGATQCASKDVCKRAMRIIEDLICKK